MNTVFEATVTSTEGDKFTLSGNDLSVLVSMIEDCGGDTSESVPVPLSSHALERFVFYRKHPRQLSLLLGFAVRELLCEVTELTLDGTLVADLLLFYCATDFFCDTVEDKVTTAVQSVIEALWHIDALEVYNLVLEGISANQESILIPQCVLSPWLKCSDPSSYGLKLMAEAFPGYITNFNISYTETLPSTETIDFLKRNNVAFSLLKAFFQSPDDKKTAEICLAAVKEDGFNQYGSVLSDVPEDKKTPDVCLAAVKQYGCVLIDVPENKKTDEVCFAAVKHCGSALFFVPKDKKTAKLCFVAVKNHGLALQSVPGDKKTTDLCLTAVEQDGWALRYVPDDKKTDEVCLAAVKQNATALKFVPEDKKDTVRHSLRN